MPIQPTPEEVTRYGLAELPDELQELHVQAASVEVNPLLRVQPFKLLYTIWHLLGLLFVCLPYWTITAIPASARPRPDWSISKTVRIKFFKRIQILVARVELDNLGRDIQAVPKPSTLKYSVHTFIPPLDPNLLTGFPLLALRIAESRRGTWASHFQPRLSPFTAWLTSILDPRRAERFGGGALVEAASKLMGEGDEGRVELRKGGLMGMGVNGAGFWFGEGGEPSRDGDGLVALNFHGGAYLTGSASEHDGTGNHPKFLIAHTEISHVLHAEYRLSSTSPFPAPLIDAIAAYAYLVNHKGIDPSRIIVSGDSAGAHLCLGLVRYLRDEGESIGLAKPRGMLLLSPWADLTLSGMADQTSAGWTNEATDIIHDSLAPYAIGLCSLALPAAFLSSPYLSPSARHVPRRSTGPLSFEGFPATCVIWGEAERLRDEARDLVGRMKDGGVAVSAHEIYGAVHDHICFPSFQSSEIAVAFEAISSWVSALFSPRDSPLTPYPDLFCPSTPTRRIRETTASTVDSSDSSSSSEPIDTPSEDDEEGQVGDMAKEVIVALEAAVADSGNEDDGGSSRCLRRSSWRSEV